MNNPLMFLRKTFSFVAAKAISLAGKDTLDLRWEESREGPLRFNIINNARERTETVASVTFLLGTVVKLKF